MKARRLETRRKRQRGSARRLGMASFPSGHAMNSAFVYLTLATLLARAQQGRLVRIYLLSVAITLTLLVGISRVYLGVHWPTDVLAGWSAGAIWAAICSLIEKRLLQQRRIEGGGPTVR